VQQLMRQHWIELHPEATLLDAVQLMRLARIRQVPAVSDGILRGMVTYRELLEALVEQPDREGGSPVGPWIGDPPATAEATTSLAEAASRMARAAVGCLPVVETTERGPRLLGLVTEGDLLRAAYEGGVPAAGA
jgi:acetoin utilization protein AcuB